MFTKILKGAPYGNENAKGYGGGKNQGDTRGGGAAKEYNPAENSDSVDYSNYKYVKYVKPVKPVEPTTDTAPEEKKRQAGSKSISGHEAIHRLISEGWEVARVKGSHHIMKKPGMPPVPVPGHNADMGIGLLKAISKQTGVVF